MIQDDVVRELVSAGGALEEDAIGFLGELVRTPSENPPGEYAAVHELVVDRFESYGWACETVWTPEDRLAELGIPKGYPRPNLLATVAEGSGPTIALNAHFDTVPADPAGWSYPPFAAEIDAGRLYGRGATDSKGRIAAYTLAVRALERAGVVPDATVVLAITADEETGGEAGPGYVVECGALDADYVIVEGSCEDVRHAAAGVNHYEVTVEGRAAHAGTRLEEGANAILAANRLVSATEALAAELADRPSDIAGIGPPTCTPGTIRGGVKTNVVPAECVFTVDQRVPPDFDHDELEAEFVRALGAVELPAGTDYGIERVLRAGSSWTPADSHLVRTMQAAATAVFDREVPVRGTRGFTDARFFADAGAETVHYGPGDAVSNQHGVDESIALAQVRDAGVAVAAAVAALGTPE